MNSPFFEVVKAPIIVNDIEVKNRQALVNIENNEVLGIIGKKYEIVKNSMVNELFMEALKDYHITKTIDHLDAIGSRWRRILVFGDDALNFNIVNSDQVSLALQLANSYDAKTSFGFEIFGARSICENGLIVGKKTFLGMYYHHFQNNPAKLLTDLQAKFTVFTDIIAQWRSWAKIPYTTAQFKQFLAANTKIVGDRLKHELESQHESVLSQFHTDNTVWGAFQTLTYIQTHHTKARKGSYIFGHSYDVMLKLIDAFIEQHKI